MQEEEEKEEEEEEEWTGLETEHEEMHDWQS